VARKWAERKRLRVVAAGHAIVCKKTGTIWFVDFVFEDPRKGLCFLASIYQTTSRGGPMLAYARTYMRDLQRVCNRDMNFFPRVVAMCVYGNRTGTGLCRVYARDVGAY
jgi:hypothetical protein